MELTPGRQGRTYDEVAAVAERMVARNERPSLRAVRAELGSGSMGTIQKHLSVWQASRRPAMSGGAGLSAEIQRVILAEIERSVSEARATLEADLAGVKADRDLLTEDNEQQSTQLEQQAADLAARDAIQQQQTGRIAQLEADLAQLNAANAREREATEQARLALAKAELRLEALPRLEAELERLRATLDEERAGRHQAEQQSAVLQAQLTGLETRLAEARAREDKAVAALEAQQLRATPGAPA